MLNTLVPPQISPFSAIKRDLNRPLLVNAHVPAVLQTTEEANPSTLAQTTDLATNPSGTAHVIDPVQDPTFGYQITLTAVVPEGGAGLKHELALKESTDVPNLEELNAPRAQRRSARVSSKRSKAAAPYSKRRPPQKSPPAKQTTPTITSAPAASNPFTTVLDRSRPQPQNSSPLGSNQSSPSSFVTSTSSNTLRMPEQTPEYQLVPEAAAVMPESDLGLNFDENEQKIVHATIEAFQTGTLTPLIKEELRCTIQSRRLAQGKGELKVEFKSPPKRKEMSDEERRRAVKRRQQNREAAQRFRQRQKDTSDYLSAKIDRLQKNSDSLLKNLELLRKERDELREMLSSHLLICTRHNHSGQTEEIEVEQFLKELPTSHSVTSQAGASACPDTGGSGSSVFFPDNCADSGTVQVIQPSEELCKMLENSSGLFYADDIVPGFEGVEEKFIEVPTEVCYEEVVMGESDYADKDRLDSCSSVETYATYDSFASETLSLSESTSDVRHSLSSAYSRVHMSSCSSEPFETRFLDQDFLLSEEETP